MEEFERLESEIEAELSALKSHLDVRVPRDVIGRTRLAARIALDEHWLDSHDDPALSPKARNRLLTTVRRSIQPPGAQPVRRAWWVRNTRVLSALASAAMIAVCVGIIHQAGSRSRHVRSGETQSEPLVAFVNTDRVAGDSEVNTVALGLDLDDLEASIMQWPGETDRLEDGLQQLDEQLDSLQMDTDETL